MAFGAHGSYAVRMDDGLGGVVGADAEFEELVVDEPTERRKVVGSVVDDPAKSPSNSDAKNTDRLPG